MYIKNFQELARTPERKTILEIIESGLAAIDPKYYLEEAIGLLGEELLIRGQHISLKPFRRIFLIGFGKGSALVAQHLERLLNNRLTAGWVIDLVFVPLEKVKLTIGTHPQPSDINITFTENVLRHMMELTSEDLVLVVACGGGSSLFESPQGISLERLKSVMEYLMSAGATIQELNTIRKHLSAVKGGQLLKHLAPARVCTLVVSDIPGDLPDLVASGPTGRDVTTVDETRIILEHYGVQIDFSLHETPKDEVGFQYSQIITLLDNHFALKAMADMAVKLGYQSVLVSDQLNGEVATVAKSFGQSFLRGAVYLAGGETTVALEETSNPAFADRLRRASNRQETGSRRFGVGGRNQELALRVLQNLSVDSVFAAINSDGWDNSPAAGAIVDGISLERAKQKNFNLEKAIDNHDSFTFCSAVGDAIMTDRLPSNVADLMILLKK